MRFEALMTHSVAPCSSNDTLDDAAKIVREADCRCIPVIDDGSPPIGDTFANRDMPERSENELGADAASVPR